MNNLHADLHTMHINWPYKYLGGLIVLVIMHTILNLYVCIIIIIIIVIILAPASTKPQAKN